MKGIQYIIGEAGKKTAVIIDLKKHGEIWEDFYDSLTAHLRTDEPRESFQYVKERLRKYGKLNE